MTTVTESIDVEAPLRAVYNQWTQFEEFPQFMEGVDSVRQDGDDRTHWRITIGGISREFDAAITEQIPDERVAWSSVNGPKHAGLVTFESIDTATTRVLARIETDPEGFTENVADALGLIGRRTRGDLERFKTFLEARGAETGGWRGQIS